jgi:MFS superfamily sulfate permease-like transporter
MNAAASGWRRWAPGLEALRHYHARWLPKDLTAGLVLTTMLVPVGIAYAVASGVPGINGLYATIVPLVAYALFGPSRIMVLGPDSSLAAVILAVVVPLAGNDPARAVTVGSAMALVSGLVCVLVGLFRLGFITGIALTVLISQLPKLLGFSIESGGPIANVVHIVRAVVEGRTNAAAFAIGAVTLGAILVLKRWPRVPGLLIAVVGASVVVDVFDLSTRAAVKVLGSLPQGLAGSPSSASPA